VVQSAGFRNEDVQTVILSHLHFDHAGGAVIQKDGHLLPTFPQAKYYAQKGEWEFSQNANARARASYRKDDLLPLMQAGVLELVDGNAEILPGIELKVTGGHTSHHQIVTFHSGNKSGVYFADIIPTKSHLTPPWVMGYDHYPLESCDVKSEWLSKAAAENWLVVFDHEFGIPWGHVKCSAAGKFSFEALPESSPQELSANALCN